MKPSLLTLVDLTFLGIRVEINPDWKGSASEFDFNGALLQWGLRHGQKGDSGLNWWVGVEFATKVEKEKPCPYLIEIKAVGMFSVDSEVAQDKREKFAFENGASLVYGAIREMVSNTTCRSAHGPLMLPTASFFGTLEEHKEKLAEKNKLKVKQKKVKKSNQD